MADKPRAKRRYRCEQYPQYTFISPRLGVLEVGVERGLDPMLMIDLLVGEDLSLVPLTRGTDEELWRIGGIFLSASGRKARITVQPLT